jgi:purine-binding chemotaxis protein CheW
MGQRSSSRRRVGPPVQETAGELAGSPPLPDKTRIVERLREQRLAQAQPEVAPLHPYLTFRIAGEEYAIPAGRALEIVRCDDVTKVPTTPPWIRGLTNLRGEMLPIIDIAPKMGAELTPLADRTCALVVRVDWKGEATSLGVLVERMGRVVSLPREAIEPPPAFGLRLPPNLVNGVAHIDRRLALVLDIDALLSPTELAAH